MRVPRGLVLAGLTSVLLATGAYAQAPAGGSAPAGLQTTTNRAIDTLGIDEPTLDVSVSGGLTNSDGLILDLYTARGVGLSPPLRWTPGPEGTKSYVLLLQDPVEGGNVVVNHWLVYNLPANMTSLPVGIPKGNGIPNVTGAVQMAGTQAAGYTPPGQRLSAAGAAPAAAAGGPPAGGAPGPGGFPAGGPPGGGFPGGGPPPGGLPGGGQPPSGFPAGGPPQGGFPGGAPPAGGFPGGGPAQGANAPSAGGEAPSDAPAGGPPSGGLPAGGPPSGAVTPGTSGQAPSGFPAGGIPGGAPPAGGFPGGQPPAGGFPGGGQPPSGFPGGAPPAGGFPGGPPSGTATAPAPSPAAAPADDGPLIRNDGYIFQVFALDTILDAPTDYDTLIAAMQGHVLAAGSIEGAAMGPADLGL